MLPWNTIYSKFGLVEMKIDSYYQILQKMRLLILILSYIDQFDKGCMHQSIDGVVPQST